MIASKWKKNSDFRFWIKSGEYYIYQILWYTLTLLRKFNVSLLIRRLMGLTDQACSSGCSFRIAWKSTEQNYFLQNFSFSFLQGLRSLKNWLLQKLSIQSFNKNFNSSFKNGYFGALIFQETEFFESLKYNFKHHEPKKNLI